MMPSVTPDVSVAGSRTAWWAGLFAALAVWCTPACGQSEAAAGRIVFRNPPGRATTDAGTVVHWTTSREAGVIGFDVVARISGQEICLNPGGLIAASNSPAGADYRMLLPEGASAAVTLRVWDESVRAMEFPTVPLSGISPGNATQAAAPVGLPPSRRRGPIARAAVEEPAAIELTTLVAGVYFVSAESLAAEFQRPVAEVLELADTGRLGFRQQGEPVPFMAADGGCYFFARRLEGFDFAGNVTEVRLEPGLAIETREPGGGNEGGLDHAETETRWERNLQAVPTLPGAVEDDFWVWEPFLGGHPSLGVRTYPLEVPGFAGGSGTAKLVINTVSASETAHQLGASLNGHELGVDSWTGRSRRETRFDVPLEWLGPGTNTLRLTSLGDRLSLMYLDRLEATVPRRLEPEAQPILFSGTAAVLRSSVRADQAVEVWDVTAPLRPVRIEPGAAHALRFQAEADRIYVTFARGAAWPVSSLRAFGASTLRNGELGAEYLIVTAEPLAEAAAELAALRRTNGLSVRVVSFEAIAHEFGHGRPSPHALAGFLRFARKAWQPAPRLVLLAGDGTYDYRNHLGAGDNLVPPMLAGTEFGRVVTDLPYADDDLDGRPDFAVGRLPARTAAELSRLVHRIADYERRPWVQPKALVLADMSDDGGAFGQDAETIREKLGAAFDVEMLRAGELGPEEARMRLLARLATGVNLVNYVGHGGRDRLGDGYLTLDDSAPLSFGSEQPLVVAMTCAAGQFGLPGAPCLSEALLLRAEPGPIALWSPSGFSLNFQAQLLNSSLAEELNRQPAFARLGEVTVSAMRTYLANGGDRATAALYNVLGDPALRLNFGRADFKLRPDFTPGELRLGLAGPPGIRCTVEVASDPAATDWRPGHALKLDASGRGELVIPVSPQPEAGFFRVRPTP